jgi:quercetin dioxygenase-like cupin family protein
VRPLSRGLEPKVRGETFKTEAEAKHFLNGERQDVQTGTYVSPERKRVTWKAVSADPHFHRTISESFFVLTGTVSLYDGLAWRDAGAGDFMYVPAGGIHGFKNESGEAASMLLLFAPGAPREEYFETLAAIGHGKQLSEAVLADLYDRHDNHWL